MINLSSLSTSKRENFENGCIATRFSRFKDIYPGSNFHVMENEKNQNYLC